MTRAAVTFLIMFGPALAVLALYCLAAYIPWPRRVHRYED